jgi:hypothetical protein
MKGVENVDIKSLNLSCVYDIDNAFTDERFIKCRLRVMHNGFNPNFSNFSDEVVENAKTSIANIPILANVVEDENGNIDFGGHDYAIEQDKLNKDSYRVIYKELPIGLIPENNNYAIEEYEGRNYVCVDAYIWREYSNYAEDIVLQKDKIKLSMEILVKDYSQNEDNQNYFNVLNYVYTAITFLGDKYGTGMLDAQAEKKMFSLDENKEKFIQMANELKFAIENQKVIEVPVVEPTVEPVTEPTKFELTMRDKLEKLDNCLPSECIMDGDDWVSTTSYRVMDADSNYVYIRKNFYNREVDIYNNYRAKYQFNEDDTATIYMDSFEEIFTQWLTQSEMDALEAQRNTYTTEIQTLKSQLSEKDTTINELTEYKNKNEFNIDRSEIEELIEEFEVKLSEVEEFKLLKENINKSFDNNEIFMSYENLRKELIFFIGNLNYKANPKTKKTQTFSRVAVDPVVENAPKTGVFGTAEKYFKKG